MQPMGHLQLIRGLVDFKEDPQEVVDASRYHYNVFLSSIVCFSLV